MGQGGAVPVGLRPALIYARSGVGRGAQRTHESPRLRDAFHVDDDAVGVGVGGQKKALHTCARSTAVLGPSDTTVENPTAFLAPNRGWTQSAPPTGTPQRAARGCGQRACHAGIELHVWTLEPQ